MEIERRLSAIEEGIASLATDVTAMHMLFRAIIATHHKPTLLAAELESRLAEWLSVYRDKAFARGTSVQSARESADGLNEAVTALIRSIREVR